jgi:hypothetical protein
VGSRAPQPVNRNGFVLIAATAAIAIVLGFAYGTMFSTGCKDMAAAGAVAGCAEFFVFRYQTLIGVAAAVFAAALTARPVWRQLTEMRRQSDQQTLDYLRRRSVELNNEDYLQSEIARSMGFAENAVHNLRNKTIDDAINEIDGLVERLNTAIHEYMRNIGPLWGNEALHSSRESIKDEAVKFLFFLQLHRKEMLRGPLNQQRMTKWWRRSLLNEAASPRSSPRSMK